MKGIIYTETVVHTAPAELVALAPYQVVMVDLEGGKRVTGRSVGQRVAIGDAVEELPPQDGVRLFRRLA
jgi:uncharacterized OB-fold protein